MTARHPMTLAGTAATALAAGVFALGTGAAPAQTGYASAAKITPAGVGAVKLGRKHSVLRAAGRVGPLRPGCELAGPNTRAARLRSPLKGSVDLTRTSARRVANITITGGAKARGVGIGAKLSAIKSAYPKAKVDHGTDEVFALTLVKIPKNGGGKLQFGIDTKTKRVTVIGVPFIAFCE